MTVNEKRPYTVADRERGESRLRLLVAVCLSLLAGLAVGVNMTIGTVPACM